MSLDLDPREVLMHLHEMGYYNITPKQLEEFIRDLKKLIKYDSTKKKFVPPCQQADETSSTLPNTTDESQSPSPPPPSSIIQRKHRSRHNLGGTHTKDFEEASCSSSDSSVAPSRKILRECTKLAAEKNQGKENVAKEKRDRAGKDSAKPSKSCDCMWRQIGCKCCEENWSKEQNSIKAAKSKENLAPPRPKSSFIRTWQVTGQPRPGSASQRSDPVTLYHQYQQLWKQQKLPGENNHSELRWIIREKMLGQEPHPRNRAVVVPAVVAPVS